MESIYVLLSACAVLALAPPQAHAGSNVRDPAVRKIIENYVRAAGDRALSKIGTETSIGTLTRGLSGSVPVVAHAAISGKWRYDQVFAWGDQISLGFDGTAAWIADTGGFGQMPVDQSLDLRVMMDFHAPFKLWQWFPTMRVARTEKAGDTVVDVISAQSSDGYQTELAFNGTSGYLIRAGGIRFEDYRSIGETKRPFRLVLGAHFKGEQTPMVIQFTEIRHNLDIDDTVFQKPTCAPRLQASPLYKSETYVELDSATLDSYAGTYLNPSDSNQNLIVSRQGGHLMLRRSSGGMEIEIKPESPADFSIWFLRREYHFLKDSRGAVTHLIPGADSSRKFMKVR